jgi:hypothetical protein
LAEKNFACGVFDPEGVGPSCRDFLFGGFARQGFGDGFFSACAFCLPRAMLAGGGFGGADGGAQIHHGLGKIPCPHLRHQFLCEVADGWFGSGQGFFDGVVAGNDALDIAIHCSGGNVKSDAGDGRCGVGAYAGEFEQGFNCFGKTARVVGGDFDGAGVEVPGAGIVAEAGPGAHDVFAVGLGHGFNCWPK